MWPSLRTHLLWKMTPRDLRNVHTTGNSCRDALPCMNMALKLPRYFYLLMEKLLGCYFQDGSPCYQVSQCDQKTPIPVFSRWQVSCDKARKGQASTLITATTSVCLPKPVSADLINIARFSFKQRIGKDGGVLAPLDANSVFQCFLFSPYYIHIMLLIWLKNWNCI